ncbi:MAG: DNA methyltransferase [bacterium]
MEVDKTQLYTTREVADLLKVSAPTIKRYISDEKISSIKFNGIRRIAGQEIINILNNQCAVSCANEDIQKENISQYLNKIICGDVVDTMKDFPSNSIDIVVTSPPYDSVRDYKGFSLDLHATGKEIYRVLKDGGIAAMVIQDQTKNFGKSLTSFKTIVDWCDNLGFKLFETVIYRKYGAEGAWWNKRFRVDHEYIPIFLKGERPQYFNKEGLKIPSKHGGKTMTGGGTRLTNGVRIATRSITINPMKCRGTIWEYLTAGDGSRLKHQHPATFPNKLPYDFIQCFCPKNGIVLDPFVGSGTTVVAAKNLGCEYIGIDIAPEYCAIAEKRLIEECKNQDRLL